jgi:hypothetical protein
VLLLSQEEREAEIARMLGGLGNDKAALANAQEMLARAREGKEAGARAAADATAGAGARAGKKVKAAKAVKEPKVAAEPKPAAKPKAKAKELAPPPPAVAGKAKKGAGKPKANGARA